jgi:hypothetical protein
VSPLVLVEGFPGSGKSTTIEPEATPSAAELARWVGRYRVGPTTVYSGTTTTCSTPRSWPFEVVFESAPDAGDDGTMSVRDQAAERA